MYQKFPRGIFYETFSHKITDRREICLRFEKVKQHRFVLSSGLVVIFRIRENGQIARILLRRDKSIYKRRHFADVKFELELPVNPRSWKTLMKAVSGSGRVRGPRGFIWECDQKNRDLIVSSDGETFRLRFKELSQVLLMYKELGKNGDVQGLRRH